MVKIPIIASGVGGAIITFPKDFLWGASTSSYQIEGGNKASALWDWEARKGWERSGSAAGTWEKFEEDLACIKTLGLNAYRFSVEWSRIEPEPGRYDDSVLERYASWARKLKEAGIRPFVCLHHFSEPAWLLAENPRGWAQEWTPARFLAYCEKTCRALKDFVSDWVVFNEPMVFLVGAYGMGYFPPGKWMLLNPEREFLPQIVRNMSRAHDEAARLLRRLQPGARIGIAHNIADLEPAAPGDEEAVERWDWFMHRHFLDLLKEPLDFLGINYYTRIFVADSRIPFAPMGAIPGYAELADRLPPGFFWLLGGRRGDRPRTQMGWEIVPEGLGRVVSRFWETYQRPIVIMENGLGDADGSRRGAFIRDHLASLAGAMDRGAKVEGYFHWSLMDNYEWGSYRPRFGLFSRDRRPSGGCSDYAAIIRAGGVSEQAPA